MTESTSMVADGPDDVDTEGWVEHTVKLWLPPATDLRGVFTFEEYDERERVRFHSPMGTPPFIPALRAKVMREIADRLDPDGAGAYVHAVSEDAEPPVLADNEVYFTGDVPPGTEVSGAWLGSIEFTEGIAPSEEDEDEMLIRDVS